MKNVVVVWDFVRGNFFDCPNEELAEFDKSVLFAVIETVATSGLAQNFLIHFKVC